MKKKIKKVKKVKPTKDTVFTLKQYIEVHAEILNRHENELNDLRHGVDMLVKAVGKCFEKVNLADADEINKRLDLHDSMMRQQGEWLGKMDELWREKVPDPSVKLQEQVHRTASAVGVLKERVRKLELKCDNLEVKVTPLQLSKSERIAKEIERLRDKADEMEREIEKGFEVNAS
jgi:soluble cytochrome b562